MNETAAPRAGAALAGIVATLILVTSVIALLVDPGTFDQYQYRFELAVTDTLLPFFEALLAGLVVYTVGIAVASALRRTD
jgi:hypothetical protein